MKLYPLAALLVLAGSAQAEDDVCLLDEVGIWSSASSYSGPAACFGGDGVLGADDHIIVIGSVTCPDGALISQNGVADVGIEVAPGGTLTLEAGCQIRAGGLGYEIDGVWESRGRHVRPGPLPVFDQAEPGPQRLSVGEVRHCPADDGSGGLVESCGTSGDPSEVAICWPASVFGSGTPFYANLLSALRPGDVFWFFDPTNGLRPSTAVNAPFEIIGTDLDPEDRCAILDVRQGCRDGVDCPHVPLVGPGYSPRERQIGVAQLVSSAGPGARTLPVGDVAVDASGERRARWLSCPGPSLFPAWSAGIVDTLDGGPGLGDTLVLDPLGARGALAAGTRCFVDYGWRFGDAFTVLRPVRLGSATAGSQSERQDTPFRCRGDCDIHGTLFDALGDPGDVPSRRGVVDFDQALSMRGSWWWARDLQSGFITGGNHIQLANVAANETVLHHLALTGSEVEGNNLHGFEYGGGVGHVVFRDTLAWHSGDDHHVFNVPDPPSQVRLERARWGFTGAGGGSCGGIDDNATGRPWTVIDALAENVRCSGSSASFNGKCSGAPCRFIRLTSIASDVNLIGNADSDVDEIYSVADRATDIPAYFTVARVRGFTLRELSLGLFTNLARHATRGLERGLVVDLTTEADVLLPVPESGEHRDVVFLDPDTLNPGGFNTLLDCRFAPTGPRAVRRLSFVWDLLTETSFDYGLNASGACGALELDGLLVEGLRDDDDADLRAYALSFNASQWAAAVKGPGGVCLSDNDFNADHPEILDDLPPKSLLGVPAEFTTRYEPVPGSAVANADCAARNVGARSMWAARVRALEADPFLKPASQRALLTDMRPPEICGISNISGEQFCIGSLCSSATGPVHCLVDPSTGDLPEFFGLDESEVSPLALPAVVWVVVAARNGTDPATLAAVRSQMADAVWRTGGAVPGP